MLVRRRRLDDLRSDAPAGDPIPVARKEQLRERAVIARFFGNKRVQKTIVGVTLGASALIPIPLLAHHPSRPPLPTPAVPAEAFPHQPTTTIAPPTTTTEAPRPALNPALSGFEGVAHRQLTEPFPGIRHLSFTANGPHAVHIVDIDLSNPAHRVRVTSSEERNQTVSSFAQATGALVAINGDWFEYGSYQPHGLAIGEGSQWPSAADLAEWLFLACTRADECHIDAPGNAAGADRAWHNAIGGNGAPLVVNGEVRTSEEAFYATDRHPRSAVGLTRDGRMILIAAEGRQGDAIGMTYNEMARLMGELGAVNAMMLDGGGSTALVIGGNRVSDLPSGSGERAVANHLAIVPA